VPTSRASSAGRSRKSNCRQGSAIIALVRDDRVIMAHHDTIIETDDHVILFMTDRRKIERIEKLFQVGVSFV
jgi:trk system potassium uptake protein TrkA